MRKPDPTAEVLQEAALTASVLGPTRFKQVLSDARKLHESDEKWYRKIILRACSTAFNVPQKEILSGKTLGERTDALRACYSITKQILRYSDQQVAELFRNDDESVKDRSLVAKYIKHVNQIPRDTKIKAEMDFLQRFDLALEEVKQKIEKGK